MNTKVIVSAVFVLVMSLSMIGYAVERHASVFSSPVISGSLMNDD